MSLRDDILTKMAESHFDFMLTDTLVIKTGNTREQVVGILDTLWREGAVRHPWGWQGQEVDWWRLTSRTITRGEKRRRLCAIIGMHPISDGSYTGGNF